MDHKVKKNKKNNSKVLIPILCLAAGILIGIIIAGLLMGNKKGNADTSTGEQQVTSENTLEEMLKADSFKIETEYCNLYYPLKWEKQVRVEIVEDDVYTVQFFAALDKKDEIHLFDIAFGEEEGIVLGHLEDKEDEPISINFISYDLEFSKEWSEEEQDVVYAMEEDVNYIMGMLEKEADFVPAN